MQTLRPTIILVLLLTVGTSVDALGKGVPQRARLPEAKQKKRTIVRTRKQSHKPRPSVFESVSDEGDNVEGRQSWFMFQRLYPFRTLPTEARRRAWESRPLRLKSAPGVESATASVWSPIGPMPTRAYFPLIDNFGFNSGRINAIAVSPANAQLILVGASTGGIWRSIDGGATFTPVSDAQVDLAVGAIAFSPSNPNIVYAGMGDMHSCCEYLGSGVLKSTDSGATWVRINNGTLPQPASVGDLEVDPANPNKIYLALYRSLDAANANSFPYGGVYVSTDGGINWSKKFAGLPRDLAINPANPQIIYAAMRGVGTFGTGGIGGLYRSVNGGDTWNVTYTAQYPEAFASAGLRDIRVAVSAANPQRVYVYSGNGGTSNGLRLAVSDDNGATFPTDNVLTTIDRGQFGYNTYLAADPLDANTVFIGARDVFRSTDGGSNWTNLTRTFSATFTYQPDSGLAHPDQHSIAFPGSAGSFYIGNDGGIYKTTNNGASFQSLNNTLSLTQFVSLARHPTNVSMVYGGTQDNGTQRRIGPTEWEDLISGDGGNLVINPVNPSTFFVTYISGTVWRLDNDGASGTTTIATQNTFKDAGGTIERVAFYPPMVGNGVTAQIYIGTQRVWTTTDLGASWTAMGDTADLTKGNTDVLSAIGVSKSNPNVIYTGSGQGRAMATTNGGQNWTDVTAGLPNRFITSIKVDYNNPAVAYLTVSGFGSGHVFKTVNTGATWTDVSGIIGAGGLPNIPVNVVHIDVANANLIYIGSDVGVFRSSTGGNTWSAFNDGMPPVIVSAIAANNAGEIYVATYGRGVYEATIASVASVSGRVLDGFGNGVAGATVDLSGTQAASTTTDGNGNYSLPGLALGGNYVLSPSKSGQFVGFARTLNGFAGETTTFDLQLNPFIMVNVHTADGGNNNLSGVAVTLTGQPGSPLTNASGNLNFSVNSPVVGGNQLTLTPIKLGYAFNPLTFTFNTQNGNQNVTFTAIPPSAIDTAGTFVRQQYSDFLDRAPDQGGLDYWTARITECGSDQLCIHQRRIDTSAAFFVEAEFQRTGSFVYRLYKGSLGRRPTFTEFATDRAQVIEGPNLEQTKQALSLAFVQRQEFIAKYLGQNTRDAFVNALIATIQTNSGVDLNGIRNTLLTQYSTGGADLNLSRVRAVLAAIDNPLFTVAEYNPSFVLMQYFGYLRRNPDQGGYDFWLNILNNREPNNFRGMVCAFITSAEYQQRFGPSVTRTNRDCGY